MQLRNKSEIITEIQRVENSLSKTMSPKLKHDYGKYLKRLYSDLKYYDRNYNKQTLNHRQ